MTTTPNRATVPDGRATLADLAVIRDARTTLTDALEQLTSEPFAAESHAQLQRWLTGEGTAARLAHYRVQQVLDEGPR